MAGLKRKVQVSSVPHNRSIKKQKQETKPVKTKVSATNIEAETDSDPILESDTPELSGENDGVSWPSDDDAGLDSAHGRTNEEFEDQEPANLTRPKISISDPNSTSSKIRGISTHHLFLLTLPSILQRKPCKTKSLGSGTESLKAQCGLDREKQKALGAPAKKVSRPPRRAQEARRRTLRYRYRPCQGFGTQA